MHTNQSNLRSQQKKSYKIMSTKMIEDTVVLGVYQKHSIYLLNFCLTISMIMFTFLLKCFFRSCRSWMNEHECIHFLELSPHDDWYVPVDFSSLYTWNQSEREKNTQTNGISDQFVSKCVLILDTQNGPSIISLIYSLFRHCHLFKVKMWSTEIFGFKIRCIERM